MKVLEIWMRKKKKCSVTIKRFFVQMLLKVQRVKKVNFVQTRGWFWCADNQGYWRCHLHLGQSQVLSTWPPLHIAFDINKLIRMYDIVGYKLKLGLKIYCGMTGSHFGVNKSFMHTQTSYLSMSWISNLHLPTSHSINTCNISFLGSYWSSVVITHISAWYCNL